MTNNTSNVQEEYGNICIHFLCYPNSSGRQKWLLVLVCLHFQAAAEPVNEPTYMPAAAAAAVTAN